MSQETTTQAPGSEFVDHIWKAFGGEGIAALAFWTGSLFAAEIRDSGDAFPFLHIYGPAGCGKTTLIETLWKLLGRANYEGLDPHRFTSYALERVLGATSNTPTVLMDSGCVIEERQDFDFYTGEPKKSYPFSFRKIRSYDKSRSFRSAIVLSFPQQIEIERTKTVRIDLGTRDVTQESSCAAKELHRMPALEEGRFLSFVRSHEGLLAQVIETAKELKSETAAQCQCGVKHRVHRDSAANHALILAFATHLGHLLPVTDQMVSSANAALTRSLIH